MPGIIPIAVIGIGCRFPGGADTPEELWSMLAEGRDGWKEVPKSRWNWESFYHREAGTKEALNYSHGYFLDQDIAAFDARFFDIPPREATGIDPQQRILMETTYEALENAGIPMETLRGSDTSVHMAIFARDYDRMGYKDGQQLHQTHITGSGDAILSNRISYVFDLKGASYTIDTGCSGSLVALHQACQSLRANETTIAIAGGSQLLLAPDQSMTMASIGVTNEDGRCYVFDDRGHGYARGEGVAAVVLKRLDRAAADNDPIHAVIVNSGVNQDGRTQGIYLPNSESQAMLAKSIYAKAGLDPCKTLFVEAHGTGTQAGDAAEVQSISQVFGKEAGRGSDLYIGSIKSNIGHLESSSGVAGLVKAIMMLKKNKIPPNLNFINPKPSLHLDERRIKVPLELRPLASVDHIGPKRVSVNSFGYGGTNAHVILEAHGPAVVTNGHAGSTNGLANGSNGHLDTTHGLTNGSNGHLNGGDTNYPLSSNGVHRSDARLVVLSANSEKSLGNAISNLQHWLSSDAGSDVDMSDLAHTLGCRRSKLPWRCSAVATNAQELAGALSDPNLRKVRAVREVKLAFIFTGQGAQWFAMGHELINTSVVFRDSIGLSSKILKSLGCDWDLVQELSRSEDTSRLADSRLSQPATTAIQIALVDLLNSFGICAEAVCGHSSGEIAAAYAASALDQEGALQTAYYRGICSAKAKGLNSTRGAMLAVGEGEDVISMRIKKLIRGKVTVACVNSPESTTISGDEEAIEELRAILDADGIFNRRLKVDSAYHSHHMATVADTYLASLDHLRHDAPRKDIAFYSSVTGLRKIFDFGPSYWVSNLVSQVKFAKASQLVAEHLASASEQQDTAANMIVEIGPHSALLGPLRQSLAEVSKGTFKYAYVSALVRNQNAVHTIFALAGKAFELGYPIHIESVASVGRDPSTKLPRTLNTLPHYAWDHSTTFWHESRLSKKHRQRPFPYHDLLGLLDTMSSIQEPRWRYHISLQALPWLQDHVVDGFVIFPGAGYVTMVMEAMKQLFQLRQRPGTIKCINFRDVSFAKPVVVKERRSDGTYPEVELQLTLSRAQNYESSPWEHYRVASYNAVDDTWIEHSTGFVSIEIVSLPNEVEGTREEDMATEAALKALESIQAASPITKQAGEFYGDLKASGNVFGPAFQGVKTINLGKCHGIVNVVVQDIAQVMPGNYMQPHLVHPATLDAVNQLQALLFRRECSVAPVMPVTFSELSIAADMDITANSELVVALDLLPEGPRAAVGNSWAFQKLDDETLRPVVISTGCRLLAVGEGESTGASISRTIYHFDWQPDVDHLTHEHFTEHATKLGLFDVELGTLGKMDAEARILLNERAATIYIRDALATLEQANITAANTSHLSKLLDWMKIWTRDETKRLLGGLSAEDEAKIVQQSVNGGVMGLTLNRIGLNLQDIITGKTDALALLIQDDLLGRIYAEDLLSSSYAQMVEYLKTLVHKKPKMKVLEIGAGTGGATLPLMESITRDGSLLLDHFTYTDISPGFFERARSKFGKWLDQIDFKTLDISHDPLEQGFVLGSYDLVVASNVLHATPSLDVTVANVRKLMKPGSRMILIEVTSLRAAINTIFGTLEGWWMSEDGRTGSPLLSVSEWNTLLKCHAFTGTDIATPDHIGPTPVISTIVTKAIDGPPTHAHPPKHMKAHMRLGHLSPGHTALANQTELTFAQNGVTCGYQSWDITTIDLDVLYIVIDSAEHPLLVNPPPERFEAIKQLLTQSKNILWISFPESGEPGVLPVNNMINGMARVMRRENFGLRLVTLDIQQDIADILPIIAETLSEIARLSFWLPSEDIQVVEWEYAFREGKLVLPRVVSNAGFRGYVEASTNDTDTTECQYLDQKRPLVLDVQTPGLLNTLRFVDNEAMKRPLSPDQIQLQARAYGINFKDVFIAMGQMQSGVEMVGEVAGVVTAVGSEVQSLCKVGDRVIGFLAAPFGSEVRVSGLGSYIIPESVSFADAASIPAVFYTAWYCLTQITRLRKGQTILIHAASGGVGQAAIQLAKHVGAEIFATVSSIAKRKLIQEQYGLPDSHIFSSHSPSFKKGILRKTQNRGVDVVLNSLAGEMLMTSWDCIASFGTFIEIGKSDIYKRSQLSMVPFDKQVTFSSVDITHVYKRRPEDAREGLREIMSMFESGILRPVYPVTTYPMTNIEEAFRLISGRKHVGKLVVMADETTMVKALKPKPPPLQLHQDGTYIIGGGLGDLGKRMSRYLAAKGAGYIVTLSRRDLDADFRSLFVEEIRKLGAILYILKCDITSKDSVQAAAAAVSKLPPVRGIIQAGLILRDHPLEYMTLDDYNAAFGPKVWGTLNIHKAFCSPHTTDFFITLSSVATILGMPSQSNYGVGNAFQDAFVHTHDGKTNTKYISINVGAIEGSEQVSQTRGRGAELKRHSAHAVSFDDFFNTLEYAMGSQARLDGVVECIMGFSRESMEKAQDVNAMSNPMFSLMSRPHEQKEANSGGADDKLSAGQAAENATSVEMAQEIIRDALLEKFTAFLGDEIPLDQPISRLGLDSLVSIELKNWIVHTFKTPLQSSELSEARSITALSKLIASRMNIKAADASTKVAGDATVAGNESIGEITDLQSVANAATEDSHRHDCCKLSKKLPKQPLPDLDDAIDFFFMTNGHLYSPEEMTSLQKDMNTIRAPGGTGRQAYQELLDLHASSDNWYNDALSDAVHLSKRYPIAPYASAFATHGDSKIQHSQPERAAIIALSAYAFKEALRAGTIEPVFVAGMPCCTWNWNWLFNSVREPHVGCDKMMQYEADYLVVLKRGHVFKVMLQEDNEVVPYDKLRVIFEAIAEQVTDNGLWTGMLTTDDRDSWAEMRKKVLAVSPANEQYFEVLDAACFVVNLDDGSPEMPEERARQGYLGDGFNRWFDKVLQFPVSANGRSGFITEHGIVDGITAGRLCEWIGVAIDSHKPSDSKLHELPIRLDEYSLKTTPDIDSHIGVLRQRFANSTSRSLYKQIQLTDFGTDFLLQSKLPLKTTVDITYQLALRLFFGYNPSSWEVLTMARYHRGRTEFMQTAIPSVMAFCDAATTWDFKPTTPAALRELLLEAAKYLQTDMQAMLGGQSHVRLLEMLDWVWPAEAAKPRLLSERLFMREPFVFAQSMALGSAGNTVVDTVSILQKPESFWAMIMPDKDSIRISLTGGSEERLAAFEAQLHRAARIVRNIIEVA